MWTTIEVPSCWEQEGFGEYNYGYDPIDKQSQEEGYYRTRFTLPDKWIKKKINLVFEGSMTDTEVKVNGRLVGPIHQGAFYRFKYDITEFIEVGRENLLEVKVSKKSANISVNQAERIADYWIFGGIYRPVYLEALPKKHIEHFAIDARVDGNILANIYLSNVNTGDKLKLEVFTSELEKVGTFSSKVSNDNQEMVTIAGQVKNARTWSPEYPNLYFAFLSIEGADGVVSFSAQERIGFRTVELRKSDGIYLNGSKIKFKGINRHSHWPESGRTTNMDISLLDVKLMKEMNLNAVRMSHYPPDKHFLDICDSLGLMVINELAGWGDAYDTAVGTTLVREMMIRDVNHPSIILWSNGNEEGWNYELNKYFYSMDPQNRPLILTSVIYDGMDTQHYEDWDYGNGIHHYGPNIVFPTEYLHAQFDGGGGAGLEDYWHQMYDNPLCAGGFIWSFADEAIVRTDLNDSLDHDRNHAADGIVGPHRQKEGSFYTIKEIFAPVYFERKYITPDFNGTFNIENRFHFTNLDDCTFSYEFVDLAMPSQTKNKILFSGIIPPVSITPGGKGKLAIDLPEGWEMSDVLFIKAKDSFENEIFTWSWPIREPIEVAEAVIRDDKKKTKNYLEETDSYFILGSDNVNIFIEKNTGLLHHIEKDNIILPFSNGPKIVNGNSHYEGAKIQEDEDGKISIVVNFSHGRELFTGNFKSLKWTLLENGWLKMESEYWPIDSSENIGLTFDLPESEMKAVRYAGYGPYRVWKNRLKGGVFNVWEKEYNKTITGETYNYPEFKGFYKDLYWVQFILQNSKFTVVCASSNVFLRLFTPDMAVSRYNDNTEPPFPEGNISFLHGISAIGTKFKSPERLGPM
ncbi:MAG: glycoside hydrolase family 2, partial [Bacteroidales bacterium]|nr:glycoside hydrolase family 2 [Bacteroidales bacterium]